MPGVVMIKNINQQDDAKSITHFLSRVFRKVVRLVIGTVSLPALTDILKALYVEEAQKKLIREGSKPTKSAIALMTGLDTRVVTSVLTQNLATTIQTQNVNPENALIVAQGHCRFEVYLDGEKILVGGDPRPLYATVCKLVPGEHELAVKVDGNITSDPWFNCLLKTRDQSIHFDTEWQHALGKVPP